jgi:hypothetical protein
MKKLKDISIIILMVAYLLSASGMLVFLHHCNAENTIALSLSHNHPCCSATEDHHTQDGDACCSQKNAVDSTLLSFNKAPCCDDSKLFVKVVPECLLPDVKKIQVNAFAAIYRQIQYLLPITSISAENLSIFAISTFPVESIWRRISSFRL